MPGSYGPHMSTHRQAATAGFLAVALFAVGMLVSGTPPHPDATVSELTRWMGEHRSGIVAGWLIGGAAIVPLLLLAAGLGERLRPSERHRLLTTTMTACWLSLLTVFALSQLPVVAVVWRGAPFDTSLTRIAFDIWVIGAYAGTAVLAAASIGLPCWIGLQSGLLPRWLIVIGAAEVAANGIELTGVMATTGTNAAGFTWGLAPLLWTAWAAGASVALGRGTAGSTAPGQR